MDKIREPLARRHFIVENREAIEREFNAMVASHRLLAATRRYVESNSYGTQKVLARRVGLSESAFSNFLAGRATLSTPVATALAGIIEPTLRF